MRQAITTKYHGPTDHRDARVIARAEAGSIVWPWDHALNAQENHAQAAEALARKLHWAGVWCGGGTRDGYVYVVVPEDLAELREVRPGVNLFRVYKFAAGNCGMCGNCCHPAYESWSCPHCGVTYLRRT